MTVEMLTKEEAATGSSKGQSLSSLAREDLAAIVRKEVHSAVADEMAHFGSEQNTVGVKAGVEAGAGGVPRKAGGFATSYTTSGDTAGEYRGTIRSIPEGGDARHQEAAAHGPGQQHTQVRALGEDLGLTDEQRFLQSQAPLPKSLYGRLNQLSNVPGFPSSPPVVLSARHPKAYMFRNFLTPEECDHLIALAQAQLAPSTVVGTGGPVSSGIRTSAGMFLGKGQTPIVRGIEERVASAVGLPEPNGEGMQILRYEEGQKYEPHYDYFHDSTNASPKRGGQRMATMLIYLKDTEEGGETIFPKGDKPADFDDPDGGDTAWSSCAQKGLPVKSVRGDAVLFWSLQDDYTLDPGSLHGACPVKAGMKWTAVKWIRVAKFDGGFTAPQPMPALAISDRARGGCLDEWSECAEWARKGWCTRNPEFMTSAGGARDSHGPACPQSCHVPC